MPQLQAELSPEWLTQILREAGVLPQGHVTEIQTRANSARNSAALHLEITYSPDAPDDAPCQLFLKRNIDANWAREDGRREVAFYQFAGPYLADLPMLVPCYVAAYDLATGDSLCLLRDVSLTHESVQTRDEEIAGQVPAEIRCERTVEALAAFHAYWWEHPALATQRLCDWADTATQYAQYLTDRAAEWVRFKATAPDFPPEFVALNEAMQARLPSAWERFFAPRCATRAKLTLTHDDCYFVQFLTPRDDGLGQTYLVDFQSPAVNFAAYDLVNLIAPFWSATDRAAYEEPLLRRYHRALVAHGVTGYTWDDLLVDYRLMLPFFLRIAIWDQTNGSSRDYWYPKTINLFTACQDWQSLELLQG